MSKAEEFDRLNDAARTPARGELRSSQAQWRQSLRSEGLTSPPRRNGWLSAATARRSQPRGQRQLHRVARQPTLISSHAPCALPHLTGSSTLGDERMEEREILDALNRALRTPAR